MQVGKPFNPYRQLRGNWIPEGIMRSALLKPPDKLVLTRLLFRAREKGHCWPSKQSLASDTDLSVRTVDRSIARLLEQRLIAVQPDRQKRSNNYVFLWHPAWEDPVKMAVLVRQSDGADPVKLTGEVNQGSEKGIPPRQVELPLGRPAPAVWKKPVRSECCQGTGWREVSKGGVSAVERCHCVLGKGA